MSSLYSFPPRKILAPTDLSAASKAALQYARCFHERFGSAVSVLHANHYDLPLYFSSGQLRELKRELKKLARAAEEHVRKEIEPVLGFGPNLKVVENSPVEAILAASQQQAVDLIIMGMHGHSGMERLLMGSVTERVLRRSRLPVLAVHTPPSEAPIKEMLCPMNPTETGKQALEYAAQIAKEFNAHLTVLHVVEPGDQPLTCPLVGDPIKNSCRIKEVKLNGNAARTIMEVTNDLRPDLIVMGAEHKPGILGELFSSTTSSFMQLAVGPLMIVPKR
jgi:nucleotide-binding universal stress UspA family protein